MDTDAARGEMFHYGTNQKRAAAGQPVRPRKRPCCPKPLVRRVSLHYELGHESPSTVLHSLLAPAVCAADVAGVYGQGAVKERRGLADLLERSGRHSLFSGRAD